MILLASVYLENFIWIGQACESTSASSVCDKKPSGTERSYFLSLTACKTSLKEKYQAFLCSSGSDSTKPEFTAYSSNRDAFYSGENRLETRDVSFSFRLLPLAIGLIGVSTLLFLLMRKFR